MLLININTRLSHCHERVIWVSTSTFPTKFAGEKYLLIKKIEKVCCLYFKDSHMLVSMKGTIEGFFSTHFQLLSTPTWLKTPLETIRGKSSSISLPPDFNFPVHYLQSSTQFLNAWKVITIKRRKRLSRIEAIAKKTMKIMPVKRKSKKEKLSFSFGMKIVGK